MRTIKANSIDSRKADFPELFLPTMMFIGLISSKPCGPLDKSLKHLNLFTFKLHDCNKIDSTGQGVESIFVMRLFCLECLCESIDELASGGF